VCSARFEGPDPVLGDVRGGLEVPGAAGVSISVPWGSGVGFWGQGLGFGCGIRTVFGWLTAGSFIEGCPRAQCSSGCFVQPADRRTGGQVDRRTGGPTDGRTAR
jgi:hypothetical protein